MATGPYHPRAALRRLELPNPFRRYLRWCAAAAVAGLSLVAAGFWLDDLWSAAAWGLGLAVAIIASLTALFLWPIARQADRHLDALKRGRCLVYWTFSADQWNAFARDQRRRVQPLNWVPTSLPAALGIALGTTLAVVQHWSWLPVLAVAGALLSFGTARLQRQISLGRYQPVEREAEVIVTPELLAVPGHAYVWNQSGPRLLDVTLESSPEAQPQLTFHVAYQGGQRSIQLAVNVPVPAEQVHEAQELIVALYQED